MPRLGINVLGISETRLYETNLEYSNKVYVCYVDYEKPFDHVDWIKLMTILQTYEYIGRDRKLIWNLYN